MAKPVKSVKLHQCSVEVWDEGKELLRVSHAGGNISVMPDCSNQRHIYIQLFQKMLSGRTTNVNCRTPIARLKRNVGIEY